MQATALTYAQRFDDFAGTPNRPEMFDCSGAPYAHLINPKYHRFLAYAVPTRNGGKAILAGGTGAGPGQALIAWGQAQQLGAGSVAFPKAYVHGVPAQLRFGTEVILGPGAQVGAKWLPSERHPLEEHGVDLGDGCVVQAQARVTDSALPARTIVEPAVEVSGLDLRPGGRAYDLIDRNELHGVQTGVPFRIHTTPGAPRGVVCSSFNVFAAHYDPSAPAPQRKSMWQAALAVSARVGTKLGLTQGRAA